MSDTQGIFVVGSKKDSFFDDFSAPPSPRNGILKTLSLPNAKVSSLPERGSMGAGEFGSRDNSLAKKQVRHSIISTDSGFDLSTLSLTGSAKTRCRQKLSVYLHTHILLILVSTLAILDAICVIGQLICDILIMKEKLNFFEKVDTQLTTELLFHLPHLNKTIHEKWNLHAILMVLLGQDTHGGDGPLPTPPQPNSLGQSSWSLHHRQKRALAPTVPGHEVEHGALYELTHAFHLGSMAILSLLLVETLLKVFAMGKKLIHHKLEIFDAVIVTVSWCLDVGFYEGIWSYPGTQAAEYLIYLLPWRVIRIVNSFVLVIQEKEHVHLKIVKQRLRQSLKKCKEVQDKASIYRHEVKALAGLCRKMGATDQEITACSISGRAARRGSVQSVLERAVSLTFISTMSSMGSVPSLFDMGDSSSEEDSNSHQELERVVSDNPTLVSDLSGISLDTGSQGNGPGEPEYPKEYDNTAYENDEGVESDSSRKETDKVEVHSASKNINSSEPLEFVKTVNTQEANITRL